MRFEGSERLTTAFTRAGCSPLTSKKPSIRRRPTKPSFVRFTLAVDRGHRLNRRSQGANGRYKTVAIKERISCLWSPRMGGSQTQAGLAECAEQKKWAGFASLAVVATGYLIIVRALFVIAADVRFPPFLQHSSFRCDLRESSHSRFLVGVMISARATEGTAAPNCQIVRPIYSMHLLVFAHSAPRFRYRMNKRNGGALRSRQAIGNLCPVLL